MLAGAVEAQNDDTAFHTYWRDGIRMETADGNFEIKLGGRIMNDWAFFSESGDIEAEFGELEDGTEFRRARFYFAGTLYGWIKFKAQYDFAGGDVDFNDLYLAFTKLPVVGSVKVGHFKEPFGLEALTSSKYITFMERSLAGAFYPSRNTGIGIHNHILNDRVTFAAGIFKNTDSSGDGAEDGMYDYTVRLTALPVYGNGGRKLLHMGIAYSYRSPEFDNVQFSERPENHMAPNFVDTGVIDSNGFNLLGGELALVQGRFSLQGEYVHAFVDVIDGDDVEFYAWYAQASLFLTGENRVYDVKQGAFKRVKPGRDFHPEKGGSGAWELAARYSMIDLNDGPVDGGILSDVTAGVNWYINPNLRIMLNYVYADLDGIGLQDIIATRFQLDF